MQIMQCLCEAMPPWLQPHVQGPYHTPANTLHSLLMYLGLKTEIRFTLKGK